MNAFTEMAADILLSSLTAVKICPITEKLIIVLCFCHTWETNATQLGQICETNIEGGSMQQFLICCLIN